MIWNKLKKQAGMGLAVAAVVCVYFPVSVAAETFRLKSGAVLEGDLVGQTEYEMEIRTADGNVKIPMRMLADYVTNTCTELADKFEACSRYMCRLSHEQQRVFTSVYVIEGESQGLCQWRVNLPEKKRLQCASPNQEIQKIVRHLKGEAPPPAQRPWKIGLESDNCEVIELQPIPEFVVFKAEPVPDPFAKSDQPAVSDEPPPQSSGASSQKRIVQSTPENGPHTQYYATGEVWYKANYKDGKLDGPYEEFYLNGQKKVEAVYQSGRPIGWKRTYDPDGTLKTKTFYQ